MARAGRWPGGGRSWSATARPTATFARPWPSLRAGLSGTVVELAANVGSHAAIRCGLRHARGEWVAIMAADGQDPPEAGAGDGAALGAGRRSYGGAAATAPPQRAGARALAVGWYTALPAAQRASSSRARGSISSSSAGGRSRCCSPSPQSQQLAVPARSTASGSRRRSSTTTAGPRAGGRSKWRLGRRVKLALDMVTGFSPAPIRVASVVGIAGGALGLVLGLVVLVRAAFGDVSGPGMGVADGGDIGHGRRDARGAGPAGRVRVADPRRAAAPPAVHRGGRERVPGGAAQGSGEP